MSKTIIQLRIEKKRLLKLANKQFQEDRKIRAAQEEKGRLRKQVRVLKRRTSRTVLTKTRRLTKSLKSRVTTPKAIIKTIQGAQGGSSSFQTGIAFIALLVGAVGIITTLYTSVNERIRNWNYEGYWCKK